MKSFSQTVKMLLAGPIRLSASPLLWRDLRVFLRSRKSFSTLFFFLLVLVLLVEMNWNHIVHSWNPSSNNNTPIMRELFFDLARGHLLFLMFFTPFLVATAFFSEREQGTLELLLSSPVSSLHIVYAKLFAPIGFLLILLIAGIPVLSFCLVAGGLSILDIIGTYCLFLSTVLVYGCVGLFCSTFGARIYQTMLITALMTLVISILIPFHGTVWSFIDPRFMSYMNHMIDPSYSIKRITLFQRLTTAGSFSFFSSMNHGLECVNPLFQLYLLIYTSRFNSAGFVYFYGYFSLILCFLFVWGTHYRVQVISATSARGKVTREKPKFLKARESGFWFRDLTSEGTMTMFFSAPVISAGQLLEKRIQWFARSGGLIRIGYVSIIASLCILPVASHDTSVLFLTFPLLLTLLITLPITATRIGIEREQGTLDLLRTTLLPMWDYTRSKFRTCLRYSMTFGLTLYLPGMVARLVFGWLGGHRMSFQYKLEDSIMILFYPLFLYCCVRFYTALALYMSAIFQKTGRALVAIGIVILFTMVGPVFWVSYGIGDPGWNMQTPPGPAGTIFDARPVWMKFVVIIPWLIKICLIKGSLFLSPLVGIFSVLPPKQIQIWIGNTSNSFPFIPSLKGGYPTAGYVFVMIQCGLFLWLSSVLLRRTERTAQAME